MSAFFYGTLLVPSVLLRVINNDGSYLTFQPALLDGYARFGVSGNDYPALVSEKDARSSSLLESAAPASVRGTLVHGLTALDLAKLTIFEGEEYALLDVEVSALVQEALPLSKQPDLLSEDLSKVVGTSKKLKCRTYLWIAGVDKLEKGAWDFQTFLKEKSARWSTPNSSSEDSHPSPPAFGRSLLKYFSFKEGYVNLNHGSYGSVPKPVMAYCRQLSDQCEENPDLFIRRTYLPLLQDVRRRLAEHCNTRIDEVVLIPNATHGVNTVVSNIVWEKEDIVVAYSTSYGAVLQTLRALCDSHTDLNLKLVVLPLTFPTTHAEILRITEEAFENGGGSKDGTRGKVRMVVVDGLSSNPGMIFPWREISQIARQYGVLSCVDGAHIIGQVPLDLSDEFSCDFLITNCHKWLMSHRGGALLWVPKRNQHLIRTTFPTSFDYESTLYPGTGKGAWSFENQFNWTGTQDWIPILSIAAALDFRAFLGGEERITTYCHNLAIEGGKHLQKLFGGGPIMENELGELTANMVNVSLPSFPFPTEKADTADQQRFFEDTLFAANTFAAVYRHGDRSWVRCSTQVWNEISDFDYVGKVLLECVDKLRDGSWRVASGEE